MAYARRIRTGDDQRDGPLAEIAKIALEFPAVEIFGSAAGEVFGKLRGLIGPHDDDAVSAVGGEEAMGLSHGGLDQVGVGGAVAGREGERLAGAVNFEVDGSQAGDAGINTAGKMARRRVAAFGFEHALEVCDGGIDVAPAGDEEEGDSVGRDGLHVGGGPGGVNGAQSELGERVVLGDSGGIERRWIGGGIRDQARGEDGQRVRRFDGVASDFRRQVRRGRKHQCSVVAAESEVGGDTDVSGSGDWSAADNWDVEGGIGVEAAGVGREEFFAEGLDANDRFRTLAAVAEGVAGGAFGGTDGRDIFLPKTLWSAGFHRVVVAGAGAMGVDVADLVGADAGALEGFADGAGGLFGVGVWRGEVVSVAGGGEAAEIGERGCAALLGVVRAFEDEDAGAFADGDAGAVFVEGAAAIGSDDFEGIETREDDAAEGLRTAGDGDVAFAQRQCVHRVAESHGAADAGGETGLAEAGRGARAMTAGDEFGEFKWLHTAEQVDVGGVAVLAVLGVISFVEVHSADGGGEEDAHAEAA